MLNFRELSDILSDNSEDTLIPIKVTPGASSNRLGEIIKTADHLKALKVYVTKIPEQGKANDAVVLLIAKTWDLPKGLVTVKRGLKSRNKTISILMQKERLLKHLQERGILK